MMLPTQAVDDVADRRTRQRTSPADAMTAVPDGSSAAAASVGTGGTSGQMLRPATATCRVEPSAVSSTVGSRLGVGVRRLRRRRYNRPATSRRRPGLAEPSAGVARRPIDGKLGGADGGGILGVGDMDADGHVRAGPHGKLRGHLRPRTTDQPRERPDDHQTAGASSNAPTVLPVVVEVDGRHALPRRSATFCARRRPGPPACRRRGAAGTHWSVPYSGRITSGGSAAATAWSRPEEVDDRPDAVRRQLTERRSARPIPVERSPGCPRPAPGQQHGHVLPAARLHVLVGVLADQAGLEADSLPLVGWGRAVEPRAEPRRADDEHPPCGGDLTHRPDRPAVAFLRDIGVQYDVQPVLTEQGTEPPYGVDVRVVVVRV